MPVKAKMPAYYGHMMGKQGNCLEKEIMQRTILGACRRGRPRTAWLVSIKTWWTGLPVENSVRMARGSSDKWTKYILGVAKDG